MNKHFSKAKTLVFSTTAKDTYILFVGNVASAFLGFLFTVLVARALSVSDFGVFSAATNMIFIIASLSDLGVSAGLVNFVAKARTRGEEHEALQYVKSAFYVRFIAVGAIALFIALFPKFVAVNLLATNDAVVTYWVAVVSVGFLLATLFPFVFQAKRQFVRSALIEVGLSLFRLLLAVIVFVFMGLTINAALGTFAFGSYVAFILGIALLGYKFLFVSVKSDIHKKLLKFSGWLGVNKIISSISGRLDVQMLAGLAGATATGLYSIPSRLALFIVVLTSSFSSVLAPRFASFDNKDIEKKYLVKATLALVPMVIGIVFWILIAEPFILILFGEKYADAVPVFQALAASMIPFLLTAPSVTAIVYAIKKPFYIGLFSIFQLVTIFILNYVFIPKYGPIGPTITFLIIHMILAGYTWFIVIRHYWFGK